MKITKYIHSCLVVETPDRTAVFDPGMMSAEALGQALDSGKIGRLDDIFITHVHGDHCDPALIKKLLEKFPDARITGPADVVEALAQENIKAIGQPPEGVALFDAPHENVAPLIGQQPQEYGYHYLGQLSDPGDSHSFKETQAILALPVQAPWGSTIRAINLALELKPKHILPIHDWHWSEQARQQTYDRLERVFSDKGITFHKLVTGEPVEIND